ncbi:SDR family oxidoreductase [Kordiimonas laminariae]|uniref:SDR family oxidoreductase n=1 Tax=Kordiimonas laminariae TaxID=2917717 RepID=UPI001FF546DC|nr:SDR family oxidoreductase [Kordiimonas laminariae]MCK0068479.1 SDR family oxidoreductase [Kordiimonas laminariae]
MLQDKVIIVTGATSGIGWGIAQEVYRQGSKLVLHGRSLKEAEAAVEKLGKRAFPVEGDLTDETVLDALVPAAVEAFGKLDGLVNNAAVMTRDDVEHTTRDLHDEIMAINCRAPLFLSQSAIKQFLRQGSEGAIVNIGSINAYCGQNNTLTYSMAKGALQTMTRNLGDALGPQRIRVNQLNVGWTDTENEDRIQKLQGMGADWREQIPPVFAPSGQLLQPHNIAAHAVFWLSDLSAPVNGQVYEVEQYPVIGRNKINVAERASNA